MLLLKTYDFISSFTKLVNQLTTTIHFFIQETIITIPISKIRTVSEIGFFVYNSNIDIFWITTNSHIEKYSYNDWQSQHQVGHSKEFVSVNLGI